MHLLAPCQTEGPLRLLYRDPWLVAAYKPSGLAVHHSALVRTGEAMVQALRDTLGQFVYPVHRLDRPTSGLIVFALSSAAARLLSAQFRGHRVEKTYLAVVRGWPPAQGLIDHPVPSAAGQVQQSAQTTYRCLQTVELSTPCGPYACSRYALLELRPHTGRHHQLRRHLKHIAHPVIGDTEHGDGRHNRLFREHFGIHRLLLQAVGLAFDHPQHGERLCLSCAPDADLLRVFAGSAAPITAALGNLAPAAGSR